MKKIIAIIATVLIALSASAQWNRLNIGVDYAWQDSPIRFESTHPDRAVHLNIGYRLWQHWDVGVYIGVQYGYCYNGGTTTYLLDGSECQNSYIQAIKGFCFTNGVQVQYHITPFRKLYEWRWDGMLRLGFTPGGSEIDNFWAGIGLSYRLGDHVSLLMNGDLGSFRPSRLINNILDYNQVPVRLSLGVNVNL